MDSGLPTPRRQMSSSVSMAQAPGNSSELEQSILDAQADDILQPGGPDNETFTGMPSIEASQEEVLPDADDDDEDDNAEAALDESYPELINKTAQMNRLTTKIVEMDERAENPYTMLGDMVEAVKGDAENEKKLAAVIALFNTARVDPDLRNFVAALFDAQKVYYDTKEERAATELELKRLTNLYFAQKEREHQAKLAKEKASIFGKLKGKVVAKIETKKEKEKAKGESSSAPKKRKA